MKKLLITLSFLLIANCSQEATQFEKCFDINKQRLHAEKVNEYYVLINDDLVNQQHAAILLAPNFFVPENMTKNEAIETFKLDWAIDDMTFYKVSYLTEQIQYQEEQIQYYEEEIQAVATKNVYTYIGKLQVEHFNRLYEYNLNYYKKAFKPEIIEAAKNACHAQGIY